MGMSPKSKVILINLLSVLAILNCSQKSVDPENIYSNLLNDVVFVPASGPPGTIVEIQGLAQLPADTNWTLYMGGQFAPLIREADGSVYSVIPVFFAIGDSTWPTPPSAPVSVAIHFNEQPVDSVLSAITVDSLPHAPNAANNLIVDLTDGAEALRDIALALDIHDTLMLGTLDAMGEILNTGENSLTAILNGSSPMVESDSLARGLFAALLVSSGMSDLFSSWADSLESTARKVKGAGVFRVSSSSITDEGLAARMQLYSLVKDFGAIAVGNTAITWQKVSAVIGAAGVAIPAVGYFEFIVSFVVAELDFIINKLVIACFPSEITEFSLEFSSDTLNPGDTTCAIVYISAKNNPPGITPLDIIQQIVGGMRLVDWLRRIGLPRQLIQRLGNFDEIVEDVLVWYLDVINNILNTNYNAPTMMDISLPEITWDSVQVHNHGLIDLVSPDLSHIDYRIGSFNGLAKDSTGPVPLQMRTQPPGPTMWLHPILAAAGYSGGAFGDELVLSTADTVTIVPQLLVNATLPSPIMPDASVVLTVETGYATSNGGTRTAAGVDISFDIVGGTAAANSGISNSDGEFTTTVTPDAESGNVAITITATDQYGNVDSTSVSSNVGGSAISNITFDLQGQLTTLAKYESYFHYDQLDVDDQHSNHVLTGTFPDSDAVSFSGAIVSSASGPLGYAQAQLSCNASFGVSGIDSAITITGDCNASASISYSVSFTDSAEVDAEAGFEVIQTLQFDLVGSALITIHYDSETNGVLGFDSDPYMIYMPATGDWSTTAGSGHHYIRFNQNSLLNANSSSEGASYSNSGNSSGSITINILLL